jgi:dephospho-CoA kinase
MKKIFKTMAEKKLILGIVGEMAVGKSTITDYLRQKYGAVSFRFSDMLRDVAKRLHLEPTRGNLQQLSTVLRQTFGEDLMSKVLAADVAEAHEQFIITEGVRRPSDVVFLKNLAGFKIMAIVADPKIRFERLTQRSENADDQSKTWEEFLKESSQESEQKIKEIMTEAEITINNNGTEEELFAQVDAIIKNILQ